MKILNYLSIYLTLVLALSACASSNSDAPELQDRWNLVEITYPDATTREIGGENYVDIESTTITEIIAGHGKRTYNYTKKGNSLTLISAGTEVIWTVTHLSKDALTIETPIGRYSLAR